MHSFLQLAAILRVFDPDSPQARAIFNLGLVSSIILAIIFSFIVHSENQLRAIDDEESLFPFLDKYAQDLLD